MSYITLGVCMRKTHKKKTQTNMQLQAFAIQWKAKYRQKPFTEDKANKSWVFSCFHWKFSIYCTTECESTASSVYWWCWDFKTGFYRCYFICLHFPMFFTTSLYQTNGMTWHSAVRVYVRKPKPTFSVLFQNSPGFLPHYIVTWCATQTSYLIYQKLFFFVICE